MIFLKGKQNSAVVQLDKSTVCVNSVTNDSTLYDVKLTTDVIEAIKNGSMTVRMSAYTIKPATKLSIFSSVPALMLSAGKTVRGLEHMNQSSQIQLNSLTKKDDGVMTPEKMVANLLLASVNGRLAVLSLLQNRMNVKNVDLSATLDNSKLSAMGSFVESKDKNYSNDALGSRRTFKLIPAGRLSSNAINYPLHQVRSDTVGKADKKLVDQFRVINDYAIDPSTYAIAVDDSLDPQKTMMGAIADKRKSNELANRAMSTIIRTQTPKTSSDLEQSATVPVLVREQKRVCGVTANMKIYDTMLNDKGKFHVAFDVIKKKSIKDPMTGVVRETSEIIQRLGQDVSHVNKLEQFHIPISPPLINISQRRTPGKVIIDLKQVDPQAVAIDLYRKRLTFEDDSAYDFVKTIPATNKDGKIQFLDNNVNNGTALAYRAVAVGRNKRVGFEFSNAISLPPRITLNRPLSKRATYVVMVPKSTLSGIEIEVSRIPQGVVSIRLVRRDVTLNETKHTTIINKPMVNVEGATSVSFIDNHVIDSHVYDYTCEIVYPNGYRAMSTSSCQIDYELVGSGLALSVENVSLTTTNPRAGFNVSFNVNSTSTHKPNIADIVSHDLMQKKTNVLYEEEMKAGRKELSKVKALSVKRVDMTTGHVESMGTIVNGSFSENEQGKPGTFKQMKEGRTYRYVVSSQERHAEQMLSNVMTSTSGSVASGQHAYTYDVTKFKHPQTLKDGTLLSPTDKGLESSNSAKDKLAFGSTGHVTSIDVTVPSKIASIEAASARKIAPDRVSIQWQLKGDASKFDHFIIISEYLGSEKIVGKAHCQKISNQTFEFIDVLTGEVGKISYAIIPVNNTYKQGSRIRTNEVKI